MHYITICMDSPTPPTHKCLLLPLITTQNERKHSRKQTRSGSPTKEMRKVSSLPPPENSGTDTENPAKSWTPLVSVINHYELSPRSKWGKRGRFRLKHTKCKSKRNKNNKAMTLETLRIKKKKKSQPFLWIKKMFINGVNTKVIVVLRLNG